MKDIECGYMGFHVCSLPADHDESMECYCGCEEEE